MNRRYIFQAASVVLAALSATLLLLTSAWAGEFFEKDGVALRGHDPVAYFTDNKPVKGVAEYQTKYKDTVFYFASKANREAFIAAPDKYVPQYGGYCAFGMAGGYKAAADPAAFSVVDGKLYLNYNRDIQKQWIADVPGFVTKADKNWPTASKQTKVHE
jgi:YHS domain-containing protein